MLTCFFGYRCSRSCFAAFGASSLSAKSLTVWRSIWCVSGRIANEDKALVVERALVDKRHAGKNMLSK